MTEPTRLIAAVKRVLRARGITYRRLSALIDMSESGVKKLFASGDCSVGRLVEICDAIGISLEAIAREADAAGGKPASLSPAQQAFFLANPSVFYFLWELRNHDFDVRAVAAIHDLDARSQRIFLTALEAHGIVRVLSDGTLRVAAGFRNGIQLPGRLAQVMFHPQQNALLAAARSTPKPPNHDNRAELGYLGMGTYRARRETVVEVIQALHKRGRELEHRAKRDALTARPEECVEIGVMTAIAPFKLADMVSLKNPKIRRARTRRERSDPAASIAVVLDDAVTSRVTR
jgi:hypothetical protein